MSVAPPGSIGGASGVASGNAMRNTPLTSLDVEAAYKRGAQKSGKMAQALDTIAAELERDPAALARVMQNWMRQE